jgi:hypothetical protein
MHLQGVESRLSQVAWDVPLREDGYTWGIPALVYFLRNEIFVGQA